MSDSRAAEFKFCAQRLFNFFHIFWHPALIKKLKDSSEILRKRSVAIELRLRAEAEARREAREKLKMVLVR